jgi:hypothetical protein
LHAPTLTEIRKHRATYASLDAQFVAHEMPMKRRAFGMIMQRTWRSSAHALHPLSAYAPTLSVGFVVLVASLTCGFFIPRGDGDDG